MLQPQSERFGQDRTGRAPPDEAVRMDSQIDSVWLNFETPKQGRSDGTIVSDLV
jgi:hypothetical protein